jgi:hypothetical protein
VVLQSYCWPQHLHCTSSASEVVQRGLLWDRSLAAERSSLDVFCREIVFEIYPCNIPEPAWLQQARSDFTAVLAAAAQPCRQALLMGLHSRSAANCCKHLNAGVFARQVLLSLAAVLVCAKGLHFCWFHSVKKVAVY